MKDVRERAIDHVVEVLRTAHDWQEAQHALADHPEFGPWIVTQCGGDEMAEVTMCQALIGHAEERSQ